MDTAEKYDLERLLAKTTPGGSDGTCKLWTEWAPQGTPRAKIKGMGWTPVARLIFLNEFGPIPDGHLVDPACMNPTCINPQHLETIPYQRFKERREDEALLREGQLHDLSR